MSQQNEHRPPAIQLAQQTAHLSYSVIGFGASVCTLHNEFYDKIQNFHFIYTMRKYYNCFTETTQFQITSRSELFVRFLFFFVAVYSVCCCFRCCCSIRRHHCHFQLNELFIRVMIWHFMVARARERATLLLETLIFVWFSFQT